MPHRFVATHSRLLSSARRARWGYTCVRGGCSEYRVEHPRCKIWNAKSFEFSADVAALYGEQFTGPLSASPRPAFIADGSPIEVLLREQLA